MFIKRLILLISCVELSVCSFGKLIDLTWDFDEKTNYWPNAQNFTYTKKIEKPGELYWYAANDYCSGEHGGTHLDAPYHFNKTGWKVADIPLERLIAKGALIDLQNKTLIHGANTTLDSEDLERWESHHGSFEEGTVLLVKFGWSKFWQNRSLYLGEDENGDLHFPGISEEAAKWIADKGKFYGVGVDTASADPGMLTATHVILLGDNLFLLENVKLTEEIPAKGFTLLVMPMKLREGTGAPLRLVATIKE